MYLNRAVWVLPVILTFLWSNHLKADESDYEELYNPGTGSILLSYQYISVNQFHQGDRKIDIAQITTQSLYIESDYAISDRWRLHLGIPYVKKRAESPSPHQPLALDPPRTDVPYIDDGKYRGEFQDFSLGANFLWMTSPVRLEPYVRVVIPSHDYQFFANSAVGQNLWRLEIGMELTHFPLFSNWYYRAGGEYAIVEKTLGVNVNHLRVNLEAGYFLAPKFALKAFAFGKFGKGESAQNYPPSARTTENWFQHDRTTKHNYANAGFGAEWSINENYQLSASIVTTVWGDSVHWVDFAGGIGITRHF